MASEVVRALRHAWESLQEIGVPAAVMGGLAVSTWKHLRATQDVDVLVATDALDPDGLLREMQARGFRPKLHPPVLTIGPARILQLLYEPPGAFLDLQVDLLFADSEFARTALGRRVAFRLPDGSFEFLVLTCEDLILFKLLADRLIDRIDVVALLTANRPRLDFGYFATWLDRNEVRGLWGECWQNAFPGEPDPTAPR
jgi:hypothetical protein